MGVVETRVGAGSYIVASLGDVGAVQNGTALEIAKAISLSTEAVQLQEAFSGSDPVSCTEDLAIRDQFCYLGCIGGA